QSLEKPFADAKASGAEVEKEFLNTPLAKALIIERSEALGRMNKMKEAQADLNKLIKEDENGPTGQLARAMLAKLAGGGGGGSLEDKDAGVDAGRALALMNEALGKGELNNTTSYARLAIRKAKEEGKPEIVPQALVGLAQAYFDLGRYYEAAIGYEEVCRRYKDSKVAGEAARGRVNCYNILRLRAPNAHDRKEYEEALKFLTESFPNEGKGFGDYLLALQYQEEGKFEDAAKSYDKVPADAGDMYDKSLYTASLCRYLLAMQQVKDKKDPKDTLNVTAANLKKAIDFFAKNEGVTDDRKKKRFDLDAEARFLLADVLLKEQVNRPADVLPLFEKAAKDYEGNADRLSRAGFWCILANLKLGRLEAAEGDCNILLEKYKGEKRTVLACKELGVALHRDVEAKKKTLSPEDRRKLRMRVAKYYARWILDGSEKPETMPPLKDMQRTANHLFEMALDISGQPEDGGFIQEVEDTFDAGEAKQIFTDARDIYAKLAEPEILKSFQKDAWVILAYQAEAAAFIKDWAGALRGFERFLEETKILDARGSIDVGIVGKNKALLAYYFDLGKASQMMGANDKANYQKAMDVFSNVINSASEGSVIWWKAKYEIYKTLDKRGEDKDFKELGTAMKALERKFPDFKDAAKAGMQPKFQKLKADLEAKGIK
ncbi:MAG: tol-pal system YbgF family protein, partial [Planctomycetota bacterium]